MMIERGAKGAAPRGVMLMEGKRWMATGIVLFVLVGAFIAERRSGEANGDNGAKEHGGVVVGTVITVMGTEEKYVNWIGIGNNGDYPVVRNDGREREGVTIPSLNMEIVEWGVRENRELKSVTTTITMGKDATVIGVARTGSDKEGGLRILRFGGVTAEASMEARDASMWRMARDQEETVLVVAIEGCGESKVDIIQQYVGEVAREWMERRPGELREWDAMDDFRVVVRYPIEYGQLAPRSDENGAVGATIQFDREDARIREDEAIKLRERVKYFGAFLENRPGSRFIIEGHADDRGTPEYNLELGMDRARSVLRFLAGEGLDSERFAVLSCGEGMPRVREKSESARMQNRRVEFKIAMVGGVELQ